MSLEAYRKSRLVVLHPRTTAYDAARAMHDNHIGAVLVTEGRELLGVVTDRDLALEIVAAGLDPRATSLGDIMSTDLAVLPVEATLAEAVRTMRERACRRVPIVEGERVVGLVTLDDLILEDALSPEDARDILHAQLDAGARLKAEGIHQPSLPATESPTRRSLRAEQRRRARADTTYARLLRAVERQTGLTQRERAETALLTVLRGICQRVRRNEAEHLIAQLPSKLQVELEACTTGPDRHLTSEVIEGELRKALGVDPDEAAELLFRVCEAVADNVSRGEITSLRGELPASMKELFPGERQVTHRAAE